MVLVLAHGLGGGFALFADLAAVPALVLTRNQWTREAPRAMQFTVAQRDGLYPGENLKFLNAVLANLSPRYYDTAPTQPAALDLAADA